MGPVKVLLLHPPLLSAVVWRRFAPLLERAGHQVAAPDLRPAHTARAADTAAAAAERPDWWRAARDAAVASCPDADAVVAHSGGGVLAPAVLDALPAAQAVVFVDAHVPPRSGMSPVPRQVRRAVAELAVDGVLPPWPSWWDDDELAELVPDAADRADLVAEASALPESFYDVDVPAPAGWEPRVRGYLRLTPPYATSAAEAAGRGWTVVDRPGRHLDLLAHPEPVAALVLRLLPSP